VNAGHPPGLIFTPAGVQELAIGGTVIGPLPEARFKRGVARLEPGAVLVLSTDGILERRDARGEFFGAAELRRVVAQDLSASAEAILDRVFAAALDFGDGRPWEDDATVVVVRRLAEEAP
jgi:sigma-B regulation protein RsbU (phosphoserine phosphatase)